MRSVGQGGRKALMVAALIGAAMTAAPALAQSPEFRAATLGTRVHTTLGQYFELDAIEGLAVRTVDSSFRSDVWMAFCYRPEPGGVAVLAAADVLWPLERERSVTFRTVAAGVPRTHTLRVKGTERLKTPAGSFNTWVLEHSQTGSGATTTCWYAPEVGFLVRWHEQEPAGGAKPRSWQATRVERRDRSKAAAFVAPPPGTKLTTNSLGTIEIVEQHGLVVETKNFHRERERNFAYVAGLLPWGAKVSIVDDAARKLEALWPLQVGRRAEAQVPTRDGGAFVMNVEVLRSELVTVPAGTFNSFVVRWQQIGLRSRSNHVYTFWYAPAVGFALKAEGRNLSASTPLPAWEVTAIEAPPRKPPSR